MAVRELRSFISNKTNTAFFKGEYFLIYFADALFTPFLALYFTAIGFTSFEKGILLGLIPFCLFLGDVLFGKLATSYKKNLLLIKILCLSEALWIFLSACFTSFWPLLIFVCLAHFNNGALFQLQDGACSIACSHEKKSYDSVRIYGSVAYAIALFLDFFILGDGSVSSYSLIFKISSLILVSSLFFSVFIKPYDEKKQANATPFHLSKSFLLYLAFYVLLFGSTNVAGYNIPLYLKELGLSDNNYSLVNSFRVVCEILIIVPFHKFIYPRLKSYKNCLLLGGALFALSSLSGVIFTNELALAIINSCLRGFGSGFIIVSSVGFLHEALGDNNVTFGITLSVGAMDVFCGVGNLVAPYIYTGSSFIVLFGVLSGLSLLGLVFLLFIPKERAVAS